MTIIDKVTGEVLDSGTVTLRGSQTTTREATLTEEGVIFEIPTGDYNIEIDIPGYVVPETMQQSITITDEQETLKLEVVTE